MARFIDITPLNESDIFDGMSASAFTCLPVRRPCPALPSPFIYPGEEWDCKVCGDESKYATPWEFGDVIPLLLSLPDDYNPNPEQPQAGWSDGDGEGYIDITIKGTDDVVLLEGAHQISVKYFVYWCASSGISQQYIEIDTTMLGIDATCFKVCIVTRNAQGETSDPITTNMFQRTDDVCRTQDTVLIEGTNTGVGCNGECYNEPASPLNVFPAGAWCSPRRSMRVRGVFVLDAALSPVFEVTDLGYVLSTKTSKQYKLSTELLPPWAACWLSLVLESNDTVTFDGQTFSGGTVSVTTTRNNNRMMTLDVGVLHECTSTNTSCD